MKKLKNTEIAQLCERGTSVSVEGGMGVVGGVQNGGEGVGGVGKICSPVPKTPRTATFLFLCFLRHTHTHTHTHTHAHTSTHTHTYTYTHKHTHIHINTQTDRRQIETNDRESKVGQVDRQQAEALFLSIS